jgi:Ca2+:H+ antiporter
MLWLLVFVPAVFVCHKLTPESHTLLFALSVFAIVPLAALLSHATESVAAKTGDAVGGLLNATLGNLTELVIALAALRAGQYTLVKASIAGAILTNTLFLLGASFLLGGLKYHTQEYNRVNAGTAGPARRLSEGPFPRGPAQGPSLTSGATAGGSGLGALATAASSR